MPRKAKTTLSGQPAQPIGAVAGQMYGAGVEQMALQRQMPAPQVSGPVAPPAGAAPPVPVESPQMSPADKHRRAMAAAETMRGKAGVLMQPTSRPNEPVTTGLPVGPGAGPEVLAMPRGNPMGERMRRLAAATGDSYMRELAERAGV